MAYTPTVWKDGEAPALSAENLNKMEQGIKDAADAADKAIEEIAGAVPFKRVTLYQGTVHATADDYAKYTTALPENAKFIAVAIGLSLSIVPVIDSQFIGGCTNVNSGISGSTYILSIAEFNVYKTYISCTGYNELQYPTSGGTVSATRSTSNFFATVYAYY